MSKMSDSIRPEHEKVGKLMLDNKRRPKKSEKGAALMKNWKTVDEYFSGLPKDVRPVLETLRKTIKQAAPKAEEVISYNIPAFKFNGMLVWYAAFKRHVGLYPKASGIAAFKDELTAYKTSKGAIQFPLDEGIPVSLVKKIVKFRLKENEQMQKAKR